MSILDVTDQQIVREMRRLQGQYCTPWDANKRVVQKIKDEGLMKFHEWPSGHWGVTKRGHQFLRDVAGASGE